MLLLILVSPGDEYCCVFGVVNVVTAVVVTAVVAIAVVVIAEVSVGSSGSCV